MFTCPVCFFDKLPEPARDYNICDCCGTEFGNDDEDATHAQLRDQWIGAGAHWFFDQPPALWNPWLQLSQAGVPLPYAADASFSDVLQTQTPQADRMQPESSGWMAA